MITIAIIITTLTLSALYYLIIFEPAQKAKNESKKRKQKTKERKEADELFAAYTAFYREQKRQGQDFPDFHEN